MDGCGGGNGEGACHITGALGVITVYGTAVGAAAALYGAAPYVVAAMGGIPRGS